MNVRSYEAEQDKKLYNNRDNESVEIKFRKEGCSGIGT